ncbi:MAG TPA: hypothetical protein VFO76_08715 [Candidatus Kapabacteria bacterium]|nr:hypothetical protein [Candidatus Kapabacteria bacterium]
MKYFFLLLVLALLSCSKKDQHDEQAATTGYQTISVTNGGSVHGKITLSTSQSPTPAIETQKDQSVCGVSHPNPALPGNGTGISGCIVYIEHIAQGKAFTKTQPVLDQHHCAFLPYVQAVPIGEKLVVTNSDDALHNYHILKGTETIVNEAQPEGAPPREVNLSTPGLLSIGCDVHPWMKGYVFVADNPYYAVTDTSGNFNLKDISPGDYTITIWRDNWNVEQVKDAEGRIESYKWAPDLIKKQQVHIEAGKAAELPISLP